MKNVMTLAWEIARKACNKFGGKVSQYLSESLKLAWEFSKEVGSDHKLLIRIKAMMNKIYKENEELMTSKFGDVGVFIKVFLDTKLKFRLMSVTQMIDYSKAIRKEGY